MSNVIFSSPIAANRLERAEEWLAAQRRSGRVTIVAASVEAANEITRQAILKGGGAAFGWHRCTLAKLAAGIAVLGLAEQGKTPVGPLPLSALCARVVSELAQAKALGRFQEVADRPGLPRALASTIHELRMACTSSAVLAVHNEDLARVAVAYEEELARAGLADRAIVLKAAARAARDRKGAHPLLDAPVLLLDVPVYGALERELIEAVAARSPSVLATVPAGDERSLAHLRDALRVDPEIELSPALEKKIAARPARGAVAPESSASKAASKASSQASQAALSFASTGSLFSRTAAAPAAAASRIAVSAAAAASTSLVATDAASSLKRLQIHLFSDAPAPKGELGADVVLLSAPGEGRECVEIARRAQIEAQRGVPFDRMAVLLRAPQAYRAHIQEALRRAGIPAYFADGTVRPDPSGRALLALLACAADNLSARRFSEYLSLGQVPDAPAQGAGAAGASSSGPPAAPWLAPELELCPGALDLRPELDATQAAELVDTPLVDELEPPVLADGSQRSPLRWEQILIDAAVIGGRERWERRLDRFAGELALDLKAISDPNDPAALRVKKSIAALAGLRAFALPLLDALLALPKSAPWGAWIDALLALSSRALKTPERVAAVLAELSPMANVGPVDLREVRLVLSRRLTELVMPPATRKYGQMFVAPIEAARGLAFDVVFIPGMAEKIFPQKIVEDSILRDAERRRIGELATHDDRVAVERLALRLAVGAARERAVISYPRVDMDQSRPRVPSFYSLEILRAAEGSLPGFDELSRRAEQVGEARIGWPAPAEPALAIDAAEHDLALLEPLFHAPEEQTIGTARYLLAANPHLARALRFRARRWIPAWTSADGLLKPIPEAQKVLEKHSIAARSFSPTALQTFASCPYKFFLHAIHKLAPRDLPDAIEEMDPLQRGSLVHETQFEALARLRDLGLLPVTADNIEQARSHIDAILSEVAARFRDELAPAIPRVWEDTIASVRADLREWLRRSAELPEEREWVPWRFELSFGLTDRRARDPGSQDEPAPLDCGIKLRGSIDLVERSASGALRATDYKTGKVRAEKSAIVGGGETLQPVFYALTLEKLFPGVTVDSGRLYYCTTAGGFESIPIKLSEKARQSAAEVASIVGEAIDAGFLPAAPAKGACEYCDYQSVCGPYEEMRTARKRPEPLARLLKLRSLP